MVSIKWCMGNKDGIRLIEPDEKRSDSYVKMAEESIYSLKGVERSSIWTATMTYYIFYYSLYSLMMRIGVKCEIHSCSLEFIKQCLAEFYSSRDIEMIEKAFEARTNVQYYADRPVDAKSIEKAKQYCTTFFTKTQDILSSIKEDDLTKIRKKLKSLS